MNEFKGTPGPWSQEGNYIYGDSVEVAQAWDMCCSFPDKPASIANAKLIAAAPELLEALIAAKIELEQYIPVTDVNVLDKIEAALTKALS